MLRAILWVIFGGTVIFGAALFGLAALFWFSVFNADVDPNEVAYEANTQLDGYTFEVTLYRNHPRLAEYRKVLKVKRGEKLILERQFMDTGGHASFYFLRQGDRLVVVDGMCNGFVLDVPSGAISEVDSDAIPEQFVEESFGRFMFVYDKIQKDRVYRWVDSANLPAEEK